MLKRVLSPFADRSYALLRIVSGLLFAFHGLQKIFQVLVPPSPYPPPAIGSQFWIGGVIELFAGLAIALGLFTNVAAFLASGTMAVAYFQFHSGTGLMLFPANNKGETAALYAWLFLFIACRGAGPWSVDAQRERAAMPA